MSDDRPAARVRLPSGMRQSRAVDDLALQIHALGWTVDREYRFHPLRRWRFDLALPAYQVAVEVDGGSFVSGRHSRGAGQREDMRKLGEALRLGWVVVRCMPEHVKSGEALSWVEAAVRLVKGEGEAAQL